MQSNDISEYSEKARRAVLDHIEDLCDQITNSPEISLVENPTSRLDIIGYLREYAKLVRGSKTDNLVKPIYSADLKNEVPRTTKEQKTSVNPLEEQLKNANNTIEEQRRLIIKLKAQLYDFMIKTKDIEEI